tara:strand:- start:3020 stop:3694 length:675 start_codon:yes stop_codon:yes gene_type:complete
MNRRKRRNPIRRFFTFGLLIVAAAFITIPELIGLTYRAVKSDKEVVVKHEVIKTEDIDIYGFYTEILPSFEEEAKEIKRQYKPRGMSLSSVKHTLVMLHALCEEYNVSYDLAKAVIAVESSWNHKAKSSARAHGLMQITPIAAKDIGTPHNRMLEIYPNLIVGVQYLSKMLVRFDGNIPTALCAYNEGPTNTVKYKKEYILNTNYFTKIVRVLVAEESDLALAL